MGLERPSLRWVHLFDRRLAIVVCEMRVLLRHRDGFVAKKCLHRSNVDSGHNQTRGKGVTDIVEVKILDAIWHEPVCRHVPDQREEFLKA